MTHTESHTWFVASIFESQAWSSRCVPTKDLLHSPSNSSASCEPQFEPPSCAVPIVPTSSSSATLSRAATKLQLPQWALGCSAGFTTRSGIQHITSHRSLGEIPRQLPDSSPQNAAGSSCRDRIKRPGTSSGRTSLLLASITSDSFRVTTGRAATCPSLDFLCNVTVDPELLLENMVRTHVLPSLEASTSSHALASTHHHVLHSLERAALWVASWPRRMRAWHSDQGETQRMAGQRSSGGAGSAAARAADREAMRLHEMAFLAEQQCDPAKAAEFFSQLVALQPCADNYARLSKQYTDMTYLLMKGVTVPKNRIIELNKQAVAVAMKAVETDPLNAIGHIALCVSRGRLALVSENRTKILLAKEAADDAAMALKLDPNNDLAHHLMGRWHYEMSQVNMVSRMLIKLCFGTSLMQGTLQDALIYYRTAADLCPSRAIHRVEIGRTLIKLGDHQGAAFDFQRAVEMEIEDINAKLQQADATMLLTKLRGGNKLSLYLKPAAGVATPPADDRGEASQ